MTDPIKIDLPFPVSLNTMYRNVPRKGRAKTTRYKKWIKEAGLVLMSQRPGSIKGNYALQIHIGRGRAVDLDNTVKCISDLLVTHNVVDDDSKMDYLEVVRAGDGLWARVWISEMSWLPWDTSE